LNTLIIRYNGVNFSKVFIYEDKRMSQQDTHQMTISNVHESGAQEWLCLECDRRIVVKWTPHFKRIVLEPGDDAAVHTGSYGGIEIGKATAKKENFAPFMNPVNGKEILQ
jgi:hypothetical protein